jgi:hypothetical protein
MKTSLFRLTLIVILLASWTQAAKATPTSEWRRHVDQQYAGYPYAADESNIIRVPSQVADLQTAINQVSDQGIIELADGTYHPPKNPYPYFRISNTHKSFTIRSAPGATVMLDGGGTSKILWIINSSVSSSGPVIFQGITFANGYSSSEGSAGGVTIVKGQATFIDVTFQNNFANVSTTVGGAAYVADNSTVFFFNTRWLDNSSKFGGAGLGIRSASKVIIHQGQFIHNYTNVPNHDPNTAGGAINVADSVLRISNTRFENNISGAYAGAISALSAFQDPVTVPRCDVLIVNSTFIENKTLRHPSVSSDLPTEGGAIVAEDQTLLRIYSSRFIKNTSNIGGGIDIYRGRVEVYGSVFLGNRADVHFGGAISLVSQDSSLDGSNNKPAGQLTVEDSYIQGRYQDVTTTASRGGGIAVSGDWSRIDGNPSPPDMGTIEENRAKVTIRRVVFNDLDVVSIPPDNGLGGAVVVSIANLTIEDSLIMNSSSAGGTAMGGGVLVCWNSTAVIRRTTFAYNTAGSIGGGLYVQGSTINVSDSTFFGNEISPGVNEPDYSSYGAAIYTEPDAFHNLSVQGEIKNTKLFKNVGMALYDTDYSNGPINGVVYNNNQLYETTFGDKIYKNSLTVTQNVSGLNSLVVHVDKSTINNSWLASAPVVAKILAAPPEILDTTANGDPEQSTTSYVGYAWNGTSATLNGSPLSNKTGVQPVTQAGIYQLSVNGTSASAQVADGAEPLVSTSLTPGNPGPILNWNLEEGTFLDAAVDRGVNILSAPSGSVQLPSSEGVYQFYIITNEGGERKEINPTLPILSAPTSVTVLAGLNLPTNYGSILIHNDGGQKITWTAQSGTPALIQVQTPSGTFDTQDVISFLVNANQLAPGQYTGTISINGGVAGSAQVVIYVIVVAQAYQLFVPEVIR